MTRRPPNDGRRRQGFTLLEMCTTVALLAIFAVKITSVIDTTTKGTETDIEQTRVDASARQVLRQIGFAIMGSHPESLDPRMPAPLNQSSIKYQVNLGVSEGEVVWTDPEVVALDEDDGAVTWSENPELGNGRMIVWTNLAAPYLEGEIPNGMDDNGNGLIDEKGLAITVQGTAISLRLTLEQPTSDGRVLTSTVETVVCCRNSVEDWRVAE